MTGGLGFVVGKRGGAGGQPVRFELTGPMARRIDVEVGDRARVVDAMAGDPTTPSPCRATSSPGCAGARGRRRRCDIDGDVALGEAIVARLGFMI